MFEEAMALILRWEFVSVCSQLVRTCRDDRSGAVLCFFAQSLEFVM